MSSLHQQLDEMDRRLDDMQHDVQQDKPPLHSLRQRKNDNNNVELSDREAILREHDEMVSTVHESFVVLTVVVCSICWVCTSHRCKCLIHSMETILFKYREAEVVASKAISTKSHG